MDPDDREAFLTGIARRGAMDALRSIGLHDENAVNDIKDLRALINGYRTVKKDVWKNLLEGFARALSWIIVVTFVTLVLRNSSTAKDIIKYITN